jgi:hypothetical protein
MDDFVGYPSELVIESSEGEFDNYTLALASHESTNEAFVGIKMWSLDFWIDLTDDDQYFEFHNLEVLAFTKEDGLELRELILEGNVSAKFDSVFIHSTFSKEDMRKEEYNLKSVQVDQNGDFNEVFHGVGYSNRTAFRKDGSYEIGRPASSPLHEITLSITLSYASGPFGLYGTNEISTFLKITVKQ